MESDPQRFCVLQQGKAKTQEVSDRCSITWTSDEMVELGIESIFDRKLSTVTTHYNVFKSNVHRPIVDVIPWTNRRTSSYDRDKQTHTEPSGVCNQQKPLNN